MLSQKRREPLWRCHARLHLPHSRSYTLRFEFNSSLAHGGDRSSNCVHDVRSVDRPKDISNCEPGKNVQLRVSVVHATQTTKQPAGLYGHGYCATATFADMRSCKRSCSC
jgi:hypothetical protein